MKKPSRTVRNILILTIVILIALLIGVTVGGYGRIPKRMEQAGQDLLQDKAAMPETRQAESPQVTPDPELLKAQLIERLKKALEENDVTTAAESLRYLDLDGILTSYGEETVAAVMQHLRENEEDSRRFLEVLLSDETIAEDDGESQYLILMDERLREFSDTAESAQVLTAEPALPGAGKKVAIDPGHQIKGNSEAEPIGPGASARKAKVASGTSGKTSGVPEYQLNLDVSLRLKSELEARGYEVYMTRDTNEVDISNSERAKLAASSGADILVRVHANGSESSSVSGALTMAPSYSNPFIEDALITKCQELSDLIISAFCESTGANNQGVYQTDEMSGLNWCTIPATIVELGYMTNPEEDIRMQTETYQKQMAAGIADGIDQYFKLQDSELEKGK